MTGNPFGCDPNRLIALASTPAAEPDIALVDHAAHKYRYGLDYREVLEGEQDSLHATPLMSFRRRLTTEEDVIGLQLTYHTVQQRFSRRTPSSQRLEMINQHTHKDKTGAICAYINGLVTDYALTPNGKLGRICLTSPGITDDPLRPNVKHPFDSHLWLRADLLDVMGDYANPADPNPEIHNQTDDHSGCLYIGDLLVIAARINSYRSHGQRKLGVGEWTPLGRSLQYGFTGVDNRTKVKAVPMHLIKHMRVLKLEKDGTPLWADAHMLEREIARWKKQFPDSADEMRVTVTIH